MDPGQKILYSLIERLEKRSLKKEGPFDLLSKALDLQPWEVISLVGAGGKTTFMFRLAREFLLIGKKVVTTTTTKILVPSEGETQALFIDPDEEKIREFVRGHIDESPHLTVARERLGSGKLVGISPDLVDELKDSHKIDAIIIEADGAAGRPIKAPREWEPVIPLSTTTVVAILGVDGMETTLIEENVFQPERISQITGIPMGEKLTDEALAVLMTHSEGLFKGAPPLSRVIALLNKVDLPKGLMKGRSIAQKIVAKKNPRIDRIVLGQLKKEPPVMEVIFP